MNVRSHKLVQFVQYAVDDFDEQVTLLIFERSLHQQWKNLIEKCASSELTSVVGDLAKSSLSHRWCTIFDLEKQTHDLSLFKLLDTHLLFIVTIDKLAKVLHIRFLEELQIANTWYFRW